MRWTLYYTLLLCKSGVQTEYAKACSWILHQHLFATRDQLDQKRSLPSYKNITSPNEILDPPADWRSFQKAMANTFTILRWTSDSCKLPFGTGSRNGNWLSQCNYFHRAIRFNQDGNEIEYYFFHCEELVPLMPVPTMTPMRDRCRGRHYEKYFMRIAFEL
jgi:hypothetical protein